MDIELEESNETSQGDLGSESSTTVICTRSSQVSSKITELMNSLNLPTVKVSDGFEVFQRYIQQVPRFIIVDNKLANMGTHELLNQIGRINTSSNQPARVLVICDDNNRDTILSIMKPVKVSGGRIKLGLLVTPWNVHDFFRQISNLDPHDIDLKSRIDDLSTELRHHEIESLSETRLFLGVSEIGQGLRIELGNDRVLSSTSISSDDYAMKIEKALISTTVEYLQFSLAETTDILPANVVALMMLINGFASKHKKEILFVAIPPEVKKQIESFNLEGILPLEKEVDLF